MQDLYDAQIEIEQNKDAVIEKLVQFSLTDTLVFWGNEKELIKIQERVWGPILKWAAQSLNSNIETTNTIDVPQSNVQSGHRLKSFMYSLTTKELTAFYKSALLMKSVLLAMAFVKREVDAKQACKAALLEENWQNSIWGATDEALECRQEFLDQLIEIENFLDN